MTDNAESGLLADPRVQPQSYVVYPTAYEQMGNSDRDHFCLEVTNGHAWGWKVKRFGFTGQEALSRKGEWIYERRGSGHNKARRWTLDEALRIALQHVDSLTINGLTAADCATRWPVAQPTDTRPTTPGITPGGER